MILLLIALTIFISSTIAAVRVDWDREVPFIVCSLISGIALVIMLLIIILNHTDGKREIASKKMEYELIMKSRDTKESIERFGKLDLIVEYNNYVLSAQYWNEGMTDIFVCDDVNDLKIIK